MTSVLEEQNSNFKFYLVVRQFIIYGLSSRAPGFQYSLASESLKEIKDSDICPSGNIALSMKENLTVFVPTTFLFPEIRVSELLEVVAGVGCQEWVRFF